MPVVLNALVGICGILLGVCTGTIIINRGDSDFKPWPSIAAMVLIVAVISAVYLVS